MWRKARSTPPVSDRAAAYYEAFKAKYPDGNIGQTRITNVIEMLARAINEAGSATDVVQVAHTNEGFTFDYDNSGYGVLGENTVTMAAANSETTCRMKRSRH